MASGNQTPPEEEEKVLPPNAAPPVPPDGKVSVEEEAEQLAQELREAAEREERIVRSINAPDTSAILRVHNPATGEAHQLLGDHRETVFTAYLEPRGFVRTEEIEEQAVKSLNRSDPPTVSLTEEQIAKAADDATKDARETAQKASEKAAEDAKTPSPSKAAKKD